MKSTLYLHFVLFNKIFIKHTHILTITIKLFDLLLVLDGLNKQNKEKDFNYKKLRSFFFFCLIKMLKI